MRPPTALPASGEMTPAVGTALGLILLTAFLTSCRAASPSPSAEISSSAELVQALERAGKEVSETEQAVDGTFGVEGMALRVDEATLYVYEYPSVRERESVSDELIPDEGILSATPLPWDAKSNLWGTGPLLVVYPGDEGSLILLLDGLLGNPLTIPGSESEAPYPPAVTAAIEWLAKARRVPPQSVEVITFEPRQWPDSCLGLPTTDESCDQVETAGWSIVLKLNGTRFRLRADELGEVLREDG